MDLLATRTQSEEEWHCTRCRMYRLDCRGVYAMQRVQCTTAAPFHLGMHGLGDNGAGHSIGTWGFGSGPPPPAHRSSRQQ